MDDADLLIACEPGIPSTSSAVPHLSVNAAVMNERITLSHPNHFLQKLLALTLMCLLGFGSYFCFDNPGALQDYFKSDMDLDYSDLMLLYAWYSWPNVVMCSIGGFLLDGVFGIRLGTCIYAFFVILGQLICACGAYFNCFDLIIFGRFIFGIGGESLAVAQNNYAVLWFKGDVLNMVFGFQLSIARAGSAVNFMLMGPVYSFVKHSYPSFSGYQHLSITLLIASVSCWLSFFSGMLLALQDKHAERKLDRKLNQSGEKVKLSDVKHLGKAFWLITLVITFYYSAIFSFIALGKAFFEKRFHLQPNDANFVNSLLFLIATFIAPFLGLIIDKFGKNVTFVFLSLMITIHGHLLFILTSISPVISMCIVGVAYSMIACALWPLIALVTPDHLLGTAYGIAQSFQNLGSGVIQLIAGYILDRYGFLLWDVYFIICFVVSLIMILFLWVYDWSSGGCLNMTSKQRKEFFRNATLVGADDVEKERLLNSDDGSEIERERLLDSDYGSEEEYGQSSTKKAAKVNDENEEIEQL